MRSVIGTWLIKPQNGIALACLLLIALHLALPKLPADNYMLWLVGIASVCIVFPSISHLLQGARVSQVKWGDKVIEFQRLEAQAFEALETATGTPSEQERDRNPTAKEQTIQPQGTEPPRMPDPAFRRVPSMANDILDQNLETSESPTKNPRIDLPGNRNAMMFGASYHLRISNAWEAIANELDSAYGALYGIDAHQLSHSPIYVASRLRKCGYLDESQFELVRRFLGDGESALVGHSGPDWELASLASAGEAVLATLRVLKLRLTDPTKTS